MDTPQFEPEDSPFAASSLNANDLNASWVRALAARLVRDANVADDLAQDAWVAASRSAPADARSLRNWIASVVSRLARKRSRGEANRTARERASARSEAIESTEQVVARAETHRILVQTVLALDEPYRSTLLLRFFDERSPSEIAALQGIPARTVKTRLARGLERLRARLDREHRGDRSSWLAALVPLAQPPSVAPLSLGAILVNTKVVLSVGAALVLAMCAYFAVHESRNELPLTAPSVGQVSPDIDAKLAAQHAIDVDSQRIARPTSDRDSNDSTPQIAPERRMHGLVTDSKGGRVPGARVKVFRSPLTAIYPTHHPYVENERADAETTSDATGEFSFDLDRGIAFDLHVDHPSFAPYESSLRYAGENVDVVLTHAARIHGRVTSEATGSPVAHANLRAGVRRVERSWRFTETDDNGEYALENLSAGDFAMEIDALDAAPASLAPFLLTEDDSIQQDFVLKPGITVCGIVTDANSGVPIDGATVASSTSRGATTARTNAAGEYELRGADATREASVVVRAESYAIGTGSEPVKKGVMRIDVKLERGLRARGRVLDPSGAPLADVEVTATGAVASFVSDVVSTRTLADGSFELASLRRDAAHDLRLLKQGFGGKTYAFPENEGRLDVVEFGDLRLSAASLIVARVVDAHGEPLVDWWVRLYGGNSDHEHFTETGRGIAPGSNLRVARTDDHGRFAIGDLAAGPYLVNVSLKGCLAHGDRDVNVDEGATLDLGDLAIDLGLSIEGFVLDELGKPVANATIDAHLQPDEFNLLTYALSDTHGRYALRGLSAGNYMVSVDLGLASPNIRDAWGSLQQRNVIAGTKGLRLTLPKAAWIEGEVLGCNGDPAAHIYVDCAEMGSSEGTWAVDQTLTDAHGRFRLKVDARYHYWVRALDVVFASNGVLQFAASGVHPKSEAAAENITSATQNVVLRLVESR